MTAQGQNRQLVSRTVDLDHIKYKKMYTKTLLLLVFDASRQVKQSQHVILRLKADDTPKFAFFPVLSAASASLSIASLSYPHQRNMSVFTDADDFVSALGGLGMGDDEGEARRPPPRRLLRAECILSKRTSRFLLVVETIQDANNYQALLRTADSFGIQNVWIVESGVPRKHEDKQTHVDAVSETTAAAASSSNRGASFSPPAPAPAVSSHDTTGTVSMAAGRWLTIRRFTSTAECIAALREDRREIWVTALSSGCVKLDRQHCHPLPQRLAIVLGRELDGVSQEMISAADRAVFLPMVGFSESFNVSVAGALALQRLFDFAPEAEGQMAEEERAKVREVWYRNLAKSGAEEDYVQHWLPRAPSTIAAMHEAVAKEGEPAVLRPAEDTRISRVNKHVRQRMEKEGQRAVIVDTKRQ